MEVLIGPQVLLYGIPIGPEATKAIRRYCYKSCKRYKPIRPKANG